MGCGGSVKWWGGSVQMFLTLVVMIGVVCLSVGSVGAEEGQITTTTTTTTTTTSSSSTFISNSTSEVPTTSTPSSSSSSASFPSPSSSSLSTLGSRDTDSSSVPTTINSTVTSSTPSSPGGPGVTTTVPTTTSGTSVTNSSSAEPVPVPVDEPRQGKSVASELEGNAGENSNGTVAAVAEDDARVFYDRCADRKNKLVCYGDRSNCIRTRNCTFVGAISENDSFINVELLTRVYNPPYDGVNLTVELSKDKKGNESILRCSRPRFKSFQIRISWKTKTSYEPGNETQTARTLIDKNQLIADCLADQATANPNENGTNNNGRQQTLALKFYIQNNNTLVSQGLAHVPVQEPKAKTSDASSTPASNSNSTSDSSNRQARVLNNGDSPPQTTDNPEDKTKSSQEREDVLYKMCLKPTAKCFGDRSGCTEGHNCTILGVLRENSTNYNLYVVTKVYNPPVEHINLTLTLGTGMLEMDGNENDNSTTNSTMYHDHDHHHVECDKPVFKDLSVQTIWRTSQPIPLPTNESQFLETTVEKVKLRNKCATDLDNLNSTDDVSIREAISFLLKFHLENGSLVPLEVKSELSSGNDSDLFPEAGAFEIGRNGTAYLISDNNASLVILDDEDIVGESRATAISSGVSPTSAASFFTFLIVSSPILIFTSLKHLLFL